MFDEIRPEDLQLRRESGETWQILDVREPWETAIASLPETLKIPMSELPARMREIDRSLPIAVLCHSGIRSAAVAAYLAGSEFRQVANVSGGIDAWSLGVDASIPRY